VAGVRTFIGIPLPEDVLSSLAGACEAVKTADPTWRQEKWVPRQNIHITVKFLGDVPEDSLDALADAVDDAAGRRAAFDLRDLGVRAVPNARRARMLWGTFADPDGGASALASAMEKVGLGFGVPADERTFKPHATLVRARREKRVAAVALEAAREALRDISDLVSVRSVRLYSSRLTSADPVYTVLRECDLRLL
jgi:2'-5' RNA ligase